MSNVFNIKGKVISTEDQLLDSLTLKLYDEKGELISTQDLGTGDNIDFSCGTKPKNIKIIRKGKVLATHMLKDVLPKKIIDIGDIIIRRRIPPAEWHIYGTVRDKMNGELISGLTVEAWDVDSGTAHTYYDFLGEDLTDSKGRFDIWFDGSVFERIENLYPEKRPDIILKVKNSKGVVIHETEVDPNITGSGPICSILYFKHKCKKYTLDIDYVTVKINQIGPVPTTDINDSGYANYGGLDQRPFGGYTTISGRVWGAKVTKWRLSFAPGFVDTNDERFRLLSPNASDPFITIKEGTTKVWDGPINAWNTSSLQGIHTVILVVWDDKGNEYHDTQVLFINNSSINPSARITLPVSGSTVSKSKNGPQLQIQGTASDDFFQSYALLWAGCNQTELNGANITYPAAGNQSMVNNGLLGSLDISKLVNGPYVIRLEVHDRTIMNGVYVVSDWTWNTIDITD